MYLAVSCNYRLKKGDVLYEFNQKKRQQSFSPLKPKAATIATAHKLLLIIYALCTNGTVYHSWFNNNTRIDKLQRNLLFLSYLKSILYRRCKFIKFSLDLSYQICLLFFHSILTFYFPISISTALHGDPSAPDRFNGAAFKK